MKKSTKMIAMLTVITLLVCILAAAIADDRLFTSEVFSIPKERVEQTILQQPGEETSRPDPEQEGQQKKSEEPEIGSDEWWDADSGDKAETGTETEGETETGSSAEETSPEETSEGNTEPESEPMPERKVQIKSSRKDVVLEGEIITLYSRLTGFDEAVILPAIRQAVMRYVSGLGIGQDLVVPALYGVCYSAEQAEVPTFSVTQILALVTGGTATSGVLTAGWKERFVIPSDSFINVVIQ